MSLKNITYIIFKIIVTLCLVCIGFLGIVRSLGVFYSIGKISIPPLIHAMALGIFITSCLFLAMAVTHNFSPVPKLLKASLASFSTLVFLPILFCLVMIVNRGSLMFLTPFLVFSTVFIVPMALVLVSNKLTYRRSDTAA